MMGCPRRFSPPALHLDYLQNRGHPYCLPKHPCKKPNHRYKMGSEHALMIAGWTVFAVLALAICCLLAYWMLDHRQAAKIEKQQQDLELQKSRIRMIPQNQLQNSGPSMSLPDPFTSNGITTKVDLTPRPFSLLRNPQGRLSKPEIVPEAEIQEPKEQPSEARKPEHGPGAHDPMTQEFPLEANSPEPRDSLDMESLCGSPFTLPETWGKVI